jgi:hypothetical protein
MIRKEKIQKGGWQVGVRLYKNHVVKSLRSVREMKIAVSKFLPEPKDKKEIKKRVDNNYSEWDYSMKLVKDNKVPLKMIGDPVFLKKNIIKQKRGIVLKYALRDLYEKKEMKKLKEVIEKTIDFVIELWRYGIVEKTCKISNEYGIINDQIVLIDFGAISDKKYIAKNQIKEREWEMRMKWDLPEEVLKMFNRSAKRRLTIDSLNKNWGILK